MNIIVCMKQVPDSETRVKIGADGKSVDLSAANFVVNPYDEFAIEEGIRLKEKFGGEVTILTLGTDRAENDIRKGLAMGADKAILLKADAFDGDVAHALAEEIKTGAYDLVLFGKQAIDEDSSVMPQMIAEKLNLPCVTVVTKLDVQAETKAITCEREIEGGKEIVELSYPAVIGTQKGINEPRLPNLKGIMAAKKKTIDKKDPAKAPAMTEIVAIELPPARPAGKIVGKGADAVPELLRLLHEEAKVI
ncbi:electron transfer flavoprotein subunit beta/FixA family protein [bacterium]|nr:electron transfer flavoprotein subunit beta/FixA family protein [bacterium]NUN47025.1 electron transfer flavoprotein subunit beta/FixA family protein [bacterium]